MLEGRDRKMIKFVDIYDTHARREGEQNILIVKKKEILESIASGPIMIDTCS